MRHGTYPLGAYSVVGENGYNYKKIINNTGCQKRVWLAYARGVWGWTTVLGFRVLMSDFPEEMKIRLVASQLSRS